MQWEKAAELYVQMQVKGCKPDSVDLWKSPSALTLLCTV